MPIGRSAVPALSALDFVDAEDVGELVDFVLCQVLLVVVLEGVNSLARE